MSVKLSRAVRNRLDKLATYLEGLPKNYQYFGMAMFIRGAEQSAEVEYALKNGGVHTCGTAACAVGHGPSAGILVGKEFIDSNTYRSFEFVRWDDYSLLFTGEERANTPLWEWMFGGDWSDLDDHHWGAAARIRYVLAGQDVPDDFNALEATRRHKALYRPFDKRARNRAEQPT